MKPDARTAAAAVHARDIAELIVARFFMATLPLVVLRFQQDNMAAARQFAILP
jgi:hypothetical protein